MLLNKLLQQQMRLSTHVKRNAYDTPNKEKWLTKANTDITVDSHHMNGLYSNTNAKAKFCIRIIITKKPLLPMKYNVPGLLYTPYSNMNV